MKKFSIICLVIVMMACFTMSGCKSDNETTPTVSPKTSASPSATATAESSAKPESTPTAEPTVTPEPTANTDYSGGIVSEDPAAVQFNPEIDLAILTPQCGTGISIALQFNATAPFSGLGFHSPTWTKTDGFSVNYYIYEWKSNYYDTVDSNPVIETSTEGWHDGACARVDFEEELPAGEYVLMAQYQSLKPSHDAGVYYMPKEFEYTRAYKNDEIWEGVSIITTVFYTKTPTNMYGPISDSGIE